LKSTNTININNFPKDDNLWRVDYLANIQTNLSAKSEPLITAFLTQIRTDAVFPISPLNPNILTKRHATGDVGVGHHNIVNIGSVWKNGLRVTESIKPEIFKAKVNTSLADIIEFSSTTPNSNKRIITPFEYPLGADAFSQIKSSPVIAIPFNGDPYGLLIPAIEVIRFYYLISSRMALCIFYGEFDKLTSAPTTYDPSTKTVTLRLNWGVNQNDAWNIARYASSPTMQDAVQSIHYWIQKCTINGSEQISNSTFFPFFRETNLEFEGKKIKSNDGIERLLCTRLLKCSGPFLFDKVIVEEPERIEKSEEIGLEGATPVMPWPSYITAYDDILQTNQEPNKGYIPIEFKSSEFRFNDLKNKSMDIRKVNSNKEKIERKVVDSGEKDHNLSTAEGTNSPTDSIRANTNIVNETKDNVQKPERLDEFIKLINELRISYKYEVNTLKLQPLQNAAFKYKKYSNFSGGEYLNEKLIGCFKENSKINSWVRIQIGEKKYKPRGLIVAEILSGSRYYYLMEIEQDASKNDFYSLFLLFNKNHDKLSNDDLFSFVLRIGEKRGWPTLSKEELLDKKTLHHGSNSALKIHHLLQS
jgi:hypothetical protein